MKYMLLIYAEEKQLTDEVREPCYQESIQLCQELSERGCFHGASPLQPTVTATSVRIRGGETLITDGPFAETKEQLGGFFLVEARDLNDALRIAERIPAARFGTVEVRPLIELPGIPE